MMDDALRIANDLPARGGARMLLAFSGWMDGGDVSTGTVEMLVQTLQAREVGEIAPEPFYILNFPGSMEIAALFRPYVRIEDGLIEEHEMPGNTIWHDADNNLVLFVGKEPNINWDRFAQCLFTVSERLSVSDIYFVGSVAGLVPHTREPRLYTSVSDQALRPRMLEYGLLPTNYEGPSSFVTYLMAEAPRRGVNMATIVAEIPAYIEGANPKSMGAVARRLAAMFDLPIDFDQFRAASDEWEHKLTDALEEREELAEHIRKLEQDYDDEVFDTQMGDLKTWLKQRGIRMD